MGVAWEVGWLFSVARSSKIPLQYCFTHTQNFCLSSICSCDPIKAGVVYCNVQRVGH